MALDPRPGADDLIPASLLAKLIREVWNPLETKLVLAVAALGGIAQPVRETDLVVFGDLVTGLRADGSDREPAERLAEVLEVAVARTVLLRLIDDDGTYWLLLGTDANKRRARTGLSSPVQTVPAWSGSLSLERPSIFTLCEQNIGLVTPIVADRLVEAIERYPETWLEDAITEAVSYNRRNWRYIQRILENWATEGRSDEANRGGLTRDLNREKHLRGKYSHLFRGDDVPDL